MYVLDNDICLNKNNNNINKRLLGFQRNFLLNLYEDTLVSSWSYIEEEQTTQWPKEKKDKQRG